MSQVRIDRLQCVRKWSWLLVVGFMICIPRISSAQFNKAVGCALTKEFFAAPEKRDLQGVEEFAAALLAAGTEAERKALLEAKPELITADLVKALHKQGKALFARGNYPQAQIAYDLALNVAVRAGDKTGIAASERLRADIYRVSGDYKQARELNEKSLELATELGNKTIIADALNGIGIIHGLQGDRAQALDYFQRSLKLKEELGEKASTAALLNNIGIIYAGQANYARALEYHQQSLDLAEELGNKASVSSALFGIGNIHIAQANYLQALDYYEKSLKMKEELGDKPGITRVLCNIGIAHALQSNYAQGLNYFQRSLKNAEQLGDKWNIATNLHNVGFISYLQGNFAQALEYNERSLKLTEESGRKDLAAYILNNIAENYLGLGKNAEAVESADRCSAIALQLEVPEILWQSRTVTGKAFLALNKPDLARQAFLDAISIIEKLREQVAGGEQDLQRFFEAKLSPYYAMVDLLIAQNNPTEAFAYAERAKARVLLDVLSRGKAAIGKSLTAQEQEQERILNSQLVSINGQIFRERLRAQADSTLVAKLREQLQKARLDYEAFQTKLYAAHPELKVHRGQTQPLTLEEIGFLLPDGKSAALEYAVSNEKIYLFVLSRDEANQNKLRLQAQTLNLQRKDLDQLSGLFRRQLAERNYDFGELAGKLYSLLLKPAEAQIRGKDSLVIVPDGVLWELPFQALQSRQGRFLLEDYAISYAPSLAVLREMIWLRRNRANPKSETASLFAMGNPAIARQTRNRVTLAHRDEKLESLPEAEREVTTLGELYGAARSKVYTGAEARENRIKTDSSNFTILHLATHAILDDANPMYSQIVLSQYEEGAKEDGLLEAWEIMKLNLKADLVVLSACDTARGRIGAGEGVIGLTWALFVAGSPTTVVSQWKVESASTTRLMLEFHRNLREEKRTARALQQATMKLLGSGQYRHPFYWAGFVVIGDGAYAAGGPVAKK